MPRGIARKLIIYLTLTVIVVEGVFALVEIHAQKQQLLDEVTLSAELVSQTMVSATWDAMLEDRRDDAYKMMQNVGRQSGIDRVRVFNKAGEITFSTGDDGGRVVDIGAEACDLCHAVGQPLVHVDVPSRSRVFERPDGGRVLGMVTPLYNEPSCSNAACHAHPEEISVLGVVDVTMPVDRVDRQVAVLRFRALMLFAVSVTVLGFFVILLSRRFVQKPVQKLIAATNSVGTMERGEPLNVQAEDELGDLARSFQSMQVRLKASNAEVRAFTDTLERRVEDRTRQLREAEEKLIQSDRLASLGQLAASVAHEINNPLAGVINFAKLMQRLTSDSAVPPERMEDFRTYLGHVENETVRCARIVKDLLVFSRHSSPNRAPHDFNELVRRTLSVVHHRLELGQVEAVTNLDDGLPDVTCDASQMQQIVTNLVLNGAEAMEDGTVTVCTSLGDSGKDVVLTVEDTGMGIAPDVLGRIFDPFFSTKEEGQGTGLGLAVVYGIVNAHKGQIDVVSKPGEGTRFTVTLPVNAAETDNGPAEP